MLKSLYGIPDCKKIHTIGFDLDGTLYDEFEFIEQAYRPISELLASYTGCEKNSIYYEILNSWLKNGSSYNKIFKEFLDLHGIDDSKSIDIVNQCLSIYRTYIPKLRLSKRVVHCLNWFSMYYQIFLITDGGCILQNAKIKALGLELWFDKNNISISGCTNSKIAKPDPRVCTNVGVLQNKYISKDGIVFFGDRDVDEKFANNCGFNFVRVKNMINVC